ncbi:MerR family transcriptional regulator [Amycolatopsis magusensis]|uniref:MerR family transcriptional regulator n=1 Tax=Amycolatopsis magusensis TaxID=882444 RepID=UPI0037B805D8
MELLPIGRFAQRCRLSVKRLRHYDDLGLLTPAKVDEHTGHRYYRPDQARDALAISLLRRLDMPLPDIAKVLSGDLAGPLHAQRERLETEIQHRRTLLRSTEKLLARGLRGPEVTLTAVPERRLRVVRASADPDDFGASIAGCVSQLAVAFERGGVPWRPPLVGLYPLDLDAARVPMAVGIEVNEETFAAGLPSTEPELLPAGTAATVKHIGPYEDLSLSYHALLSWVYEHGHEPSGPAVETYLTDPAGTAPEELVTRIGIPVGQEQR